MIKNYRLQQFVNLSWLISIIVTSVSSIILFSILAYSAFLKDISIIQKDLDSKAKSIARRVSSELLLENRGSADLVIDSLKKEYKLSSIQLFKSENPVSAFAEDKIHSIQLVPFLANGERIILAVEKPRYFNYFQFSLFIACFFVISFLSGIGLFIQTKFLKRHVISPIEQLLTVTTGISKPDSNWALEIKEISEKLNEAFVQRDQVVYAQLSKGLFHDMKTMLQSVRVATDLAKENPSEKRCENLLKVLNYQLPSLQKLTETALDGSRDIVLNKASMDITKTIEKSVNVLKNCFTSVDISFAGEPNIFLLHDSIQLERVLNNLIKNAAEATLETDLESHKINVSASVKDNNVVVSVEDSGAGMPTGFDSSLRQVKSTKVHGAGLGLVVSKKIIEAHGGAIYIGYSDQLNGAKIELSFPAEANL